MMSLLKHFEDNTHIFNPYERKIDQHAFEQLLETEGEDVARGYMKCLFELTGVLDNIVYQRRTTNGYDYQDTPTVISHKVNHLRNALIQFAATNSLPVEHFREPIDVRSKIQIF